MGLLRRESFIEKNALAKVKMPKVPEAVTPTFTGQELDGTGLYYYVLPVIGRFISADTLVPDYTNP